MFQFGLTERRSFDESMELKETWMNVGEPPLTGCVEKGRLARKAMCEDVKMHDPDQGLFLVADGVAGHGGLFAAREVAAVVASVLGKVLEEELERIGRTEGHDLDQHQRFMDRHIRSQIRRAIQQADHEIHMHVQLRPDWQSAGASISLGKRVALPDNETYFYFAHIGDGSLFLLRGDVLHRLAQAAHVRDEEPVLIGSLNGKEVIVKRLRVRPADRCAIISKGISDQLIDNSIAHILLAQPEDRAAERVLQKEADELAIRSSETEGEGDDFSAVVYTFQS